jgi:acyl-CoA carboxylase subunit beta
VESAVTIIDRLTDPSSFRVVEDDLTTTNRLSFASYEATLEAARQRAKSDEAVVAGSATVGGIAIELAVFEFDFVGGSMGQVAGERLAQTFERAARSLVPAVVVTSTGGARMQEGMLSLVQMPKVVAARLELANAHQPLIAILGHPTTGGVLASIAGVADITAAIEGATIGFAGPRLVRRVTGSPPTKTSHSAETSFTNGLIDALITSDETAEWLQTTLGLLGSNDPRPLDQPGTRMPAEVVLDVWQTVERARSVDRASAVELVHGMSDQTIPVRGDRAGTDDPAIGVSIARLAGRKAIVIAFDRRHSPGPAAYRKAIRSLAIAARLALPVVTLIDTPGADPSPTSDSGGIAWAIGETFESLLSAPVPVVSVVTGEGGSGGALALAVGDVLLAYESSIFSVIAPEAAAEILWRDPGRAGEAANALKLTAHDLMEFGIADGLIEGSPEPETLLMAIVDQLDALTADDRSPSERVTARRTRWRNKLS